MPRHLTSAGRLPSDVPRFLTDALASLRASARVASVVVPAPPGFAPLAIEQPTVVFDAPGGPTLLGIGAAAVIDRSDHDLDVIRAAATAHYEQVELLAHPALPPALHRPAPWIGGMSFMPDDVFDAIWADFPRARFMVPRWTLRRHEGGWTATLTVATAALGAAGIAAAAAEWAALGTLAPPPVPRLALAPIAVAAADDAAWIDRIEQAMARIAVGRLAKVVLVRHADLGSGGGVPRGMRVLTHLARRQPACTRFLMAAGAAEFFGATPEMLVTVEGRRVGTEAVAGTSDRAHGVALAASAKDRHEHRLVVDALVAALEPLCQSLVHSPTPFVRRLATVAHLATPIHGTLAAPTHVLELVRRLHPTPATAGAPAAEAVAVSRALEPVSRGWFAGPFGWFDQRGDGHFVVTLRSCVRTPHGARVYAGSGLVDGSEPRAELAEMALKMQTMLEALGDAAGEPAG